METTNGKHTSAPANLEISQLNLPLCAPQDGIRNGSILPQHPHDAKAKLADAKTTNELVAAIMAMSPRYSAMKSALRDYVLSEDPLAAIAKRYDYTPTALLYWIRKLRLPVRRRGRRTLLQPTSAHRRILELVRTHGVSETARRVGRSRQWIHQIVDRWAPGLKGHWKALNSPERPRLERRPPRTVIVSFRISKEEWSRLSASEVTSTELGLSAYEKAREIVLKFIAPRGGGGLAPIQSLVNLPAGTTNLEVVDVYTEKAA